MCRQVWWRPLDEISLVAWRELGLAACGGFRHALRFARLLGVIDAASGGFLAPPAGIEVAVFEDPERGLGCLP